MQHFSASPREIVGSLWRNRQLILTLIKHEVLGNFNGSIIGVLWSFITPTIMLAVYIFVFSGIFKARWNSESTSMSEFGMVLFVGLIIFNIFAECLNKGPTLILAHVNYVKKVVFPLEVLPWVSLGGALFRAVVSITVWLTAYVILFGLPHLTVLLLPFVVLPLLLLIMGLTWFLASLGVYLRNITQFVALVTTVTMFLSPIFYPANALPERFKILLLLNPLTSIIEGGRDVLFWGVVPDLQFLAIYFVVSLFIVWLGFAWFQKTRKGFADVL
ncbi:ABC transporter permease [Candidatus Pseudomonas adelgestsugas]|uniref:Transport permease protein n=1 Tax=Candidatus Pseudomonas adelgestsugas TaxID=1302376 RepID=A0ABX5R928_9PSED|nr:ABC transporter permease [Candidatus Pseudomonas adelgestsugas]QAX82152.1 Teichoic acid translocation permease protein TagG [Candidatus Pseudomonas adelgestsugas]